MSGVDFKYLLEIVWKCEVVILNSELENVWKCEVLIEKSEFDSVEI
jgi:hypothetical protein